MKLERTLYKQSYFYFSVFFIFVLIAFWLTYFTRLGEQPSFRMHLHGAALLLWCLMLISQALLIRMKRNALHSRMGKLSYVLVPLVVLTTLDLLKYRMNQLETIGTMDYFSVALIVNALIAFVILYGLAMLNRKKPTVHARYMVCTIFPFVTPVTDRIIHLHFPSLLPHLYAIEGNPIVPVIGFLIADLILVTLSIWDWLSHRRWNVFPSALLILLMYHYSVLNFHKFEFWKSFSHWFIGL